MKSKILFYNSISPLIFQVTTIVCGFILPKLILDYFGSDINGLINSISQFLGIIAFLELGVGAVVKTSLYKPLAERDNVSISQIINSANDFFRKLGYILLVYVFAMIILYPILVAQKFNSVFVISLIITISIRLFAQYFFGIVNRLLLVADQKAYIQYNAQTLAVLINTFACFWLIRLRFSIQIVYGMTSFIFFLQPFLIHLYIRKKYKIIKNIVINKEPIKQKWNGIAQHISALVLDSSDIIVLSVFSTLADVSIYSVYMLVVKGIKQLCLSLINGIQALIGNIWAKKEMNILYKTFSWAEWVIHNITVIVFALTTVLIVPFVKLFTININDLSYVRPEFATIVVLANAIYCLSLPYLMLILAAGHFKETQSKFLISSLLNVLVSIFLVKKVGLEGVALGTLVTMLFQLSWMIKYIHKELLHTNKIDSIRLTVIDLIEYLTIIAIGRLCTFEITDYFSWFKFATTITLISCFIALTINYVFNRKYMTAILQKIINLFFR